MEGTIKVFEEQVKELKAELIKKIAVEDIIEMDSDEFIIIQKMLRFMDTSMELYVGQARMINDINDKLNQLIGLEKREA